MKNNKVLGIILWAVGLAASLLALFLIPAKLTGTIWVVAVCTVLVYGGNLALWLVLQKGTLDFLNFPALTLSVLFLVLQTLWAVVVSFAAASIPTKIAILLNALLILAQVVMALLALMGKNSTEKTHTRQKDYHIKL